MLALRWHARHDLRLEEVEEPRAAPGFALIEVDFCGICGSDLGEYRSGPVMIPTKPHALSGRCAPVTMGHELSGRLVEAAGDLPAGARVTVDTCSGSATSVYSGTRTSRAKPPSEWSPIEPP
jgi:(R,R)-butanediol dehydrogenase/meso-butanediol dehydrogenase/diacetyl reductase